MYVNCVPNHANKHIIVNHIIGGRSEMKDWSLKGASNLHQRNWIKIEHSRNWSKLKPKLAGNWPCESKLKLKQIMSNTKIKNKIVLFDYEMNEHNWRNESLPSCYLFALFIYMHYFLQFYIFVYQSFNRKNLFTRFPIYLSIYLSINIHFYVA